MSLTKIWSLCVKSSSKTIKLPSSSPGRSPTKIVSICYVCLTTVCLRCRRAWSGLMGDVLRTCTSRSPGTPCSGTARCVGWSGVVSPMITSAPSGPQNVTIKGYLVDLTSLSFTYMKRYVQFICNHWTQYGTTLSSLTNLLFVTVRNSSCGKVMFLQVSVCPQGEVYTPRAHTHTHPG